MLRFAVGAGPQATRAQRDDFDVRVPPDLGKVKAGKLLLREQVDGVALKGLLDGFCDAVDLTDAQNGETLQLLGLVVALRNASTDEERFSELPSPLQKVGHGGL